MAMRKTSVAIAIGMVVCCFAIPGAPAAIPAAHVYHNHMPNFWPFFAVDVGKAYNATAVGAPIRYTYDGDVIALKNNPPAGYSYYLPPALGGKKTRRQKDKDTQKTRTPKVRLSRSFPSLMACCVFAVLKH